jgi:hypothetical protein
MKPVEVPITDGDLSTIRGMFFDELRNPKGDPCCPICNGSGWEDNCGNCGRCSCRCESGPTAGEG